MTVTLAINQLVYFVRGVSNKFSGPCSRVSGAMNVRYMPLPKHWLNASLAVRSCAGVALPSAKYSPYSITRLAWAQAVPALP